MQYKLRVRQVEAHVFTGSSTCASRIKTWVDTGVWKDGGIETRDIISLEMKSGIAVAGDYIVRDGNDFKVMTKENFLATYEPLFDEDHQREPGQYLAGDVVPGDVLRLWGENTKVTRVDTHGDDVEITIADGTRIPMRKSAMVVVVEV